MLILKFENEEVESMYYELHKKHKIHSIRGTSDIITYEDILDIEEDFKNFDSLFEE